jgi:hypothetical protein
MPNTHPRTRAPTSSGTPISEATSHVLEIGDRFTRIVGFERDGVVTYWAMFTFACLYHWYTSAMYVAPVLAVGGWGWLSTKRMAKRQDSRQA